MSEQRTGISSLLLSRCFKGDKGGVTGFTGSGMRTGCWKMEMGGLVFVRPSMREPSGEGLAEKESPGRISSTSTSVPISSRAGGKAVDSGVSKDGLGESKFMSSSLLSSSRSSSCACSAVSILNQNQSLNEYLCLRR